MIPIIFMILIIQGIENKTVQKSFSDLQEKIDNFEGIQMILDSNYTFDPSKDKTTGIVIKKSLSINGKGFAINGLNQARLLNIYNSTVTMERTFFINGFSKEYGGGINLINSTFNSILCGYHYNTAKKGGAIYLKNSYIYVLDNVVQFNTAKGHYGSGGGIYSENSTIRINITHFRYNLADEGGAIYSINSNLDIYGSLIYNNNANWYGGAIVSDSQISIQTSRLSNNIAGYKGGAIHTTYSYLTDNCFLYINYSAVFNNSAEYGGAISSSNTKYVHIMRSNFYDNHASFGAVVSKMSNNEIQIASSTCKDNYAIYGPVLYSAAGGNNSIRSDINNNKAEIGGMIYTIKQPSLNKVTNFSSIEKNLLSEGCSSTVIQIDDNDSTFTFRRDSSKSAYVIIAHQKDGILQYLTEDTFFWHTIINKDGWIIGNGGLDSPHSSEKLEAYSKIMIKQNLIIDELIEDILKIKSMQTLGHYFIKAPDGTYVLGSIKSKNNVAFEKGKLKSGEYIICPNNYDFYRKGKISDLKI